MKYMWPNENCINDKTNMQNGGDLLSDYNITMLDQPQHHSPKKMKRFRSAFTTDQVNYLEKQFKKFPYIGNAHRKEVAQALNIPERAVKIWFQNRRMKEKKESTTKEFDDEQSFRKSLEFAKDQLYNARVQSTNDQQPRSLPLLADTSQATCENTVSSNSCVTVTGQNPQDLGVKDSRTDSIVTPNMITTTKVIYPPPVFVNKTPLDYITSHEPSIDLYKKFKGELFRKTAQVEPILKKEVINMQYNVENLSKKPTEQLIPEDLSSNRKTVLSSSVQQQAPTINIPNSSGYVSLVPTVSPFYAQPFISASGLIWKPLDVMPVVSSASTVIPTPNISTVQGTAMKTSCKCDCHITSQLPSGYQQQSLNPQYIITALPYQNPSTKF